MAYTKLDSGITESTIWQAPDATRLVWITLLARADQNGYVGASMPGLAGLARVTLEACIQAIHTLESPDEWSRTKEHDGRRIAPADGGWVLLNHAKYREKQSADDRRERSRIAMAALRAQRKANALAAVNGSEPKLSQAEAEAEAINTEPTALVAMASPKRPAPCPTSEILNLYHAKLPTLPRVEVLTETRKKALASRWREVLADHDGDRNQAIEWFGWYFGRVAESKFLTGRAGKTWRAGFDWLINPSNFAKVVEGNYSREAA